LPDFTIVRLLRRSAGHLIACWRCVEKRKMSGSARRPALRSVHRPKRHRVSRSSLSSLVDPNKASRIVGSFLALSTEDLKNRTFRS
jgi:hypothetical protein